MKDVFFFTVVTLFVVLSIEGNAQIPRTLSYQGVLTDSSGNPKPDNTYSLTFRLYEHALSGIVLWTEVKTLQVERGLLTTILGDQTALPDSLKFDKTYWLGLQIASEPELSPRLQLTTVGYSLYSLKADTAQYAHSAPTQVFVDSSRISASVSDNSITDVKIANGQVVRSINNKKDNVTLAAQGGAIITSSGDTIIINAGGSGGGTIGGSGTANYLPRFSGETTLANSIIFQTSGNLGIGTTTPTVKLELAGSDAKIHGLTVGRGGGSLGSNVALGIEALDSNTTGGYNTAIGLQPLFNNETGASNIAIGYSSLYHNTFGNSNTGIGEGVLYHNKSHSNNTAIGSRAMYFANNSDLGITTNNTAVGFAALYGSSIPADNTGSNNAAVGSMSLHYNTSGSGNTANGYMSLYSNFTGNSNTANGNQALNSNSIGHYNTATGNQALYSNSSGNDNTANGAGALYSNATGHYNTANGVHALYSNTAGDYNTAVGYSAGDYNTFSQGTFLGSSAYPNATGYSNVMGLGCNARPTASDQVRIGNTSVTSIGGYAGWTNFSDGRYKLAINENVKGLDFIMKLRPITYQLDINKLSADIKENQRRDENGNITNESSETDIKSQIVYTGFVAQEVEQAAKDLGYDFSGVDKPKNENDFYGLRYAEFVVPLVKAIQEQQKMMEDLKRQNEELLKRIEAFENK